MATAARLREVLKHPEVKTATQVEIDERVTRLAEQYFPELCVANNDPRATLFFGDGLAWMKEATPESLDVIIIDSTDPVGPAEGLFGAKFYVDCLRALKPGGLLVQQSESPILHLELITEMHKFMRQAGFAQTRLIHFPQTIYPSGWWSGSIAQKTAGPLASRLDDKAIEAMDCQFYNADTHAAAFCAADLRQEGDRRLTRLASASRAGGFQGPRCSTTICFGFNAAAARARRAARDTALRQHRVRSCASRHVRGWRAPAAAGAVTVVGSCRCRSRR